MPKRLILCCDGTWNTVAQAECGIPSPTNVVRLASRIAARDSDGNPQVVYYAQGVGTGNTLDRFSGGALGAGLEENVYDAYRFLVSNYEPGDFVYLSGFSRGAFTARRVAGLVRKVGVLRRKNITRYRDAMALYEDYSLHPNHTAAQQFRHDNSIDLDTQIHCLALWDTVGALGIPLSGLRWLTRRRYQLHDNRIGLNVRHAFHALAVDEQRAAFEPALWENEPRGEQVVRQVWFPGSHSDVGGGYHETALADCALEWILSQLHVCGLGLDQEVASAHPLNANPSGIMHSSRMGIYRLGRPTPRCIGTTRTEYFHRSVIERWQANTSYRPVSLHPYVPRLEALGSRLSGTSDCIFAVDTGLG